MMTKACRKSRSGYTGGRPRPRVEGTGIGILSTSLTKVTSKDSCSNIGHLRTRWLGEPLCYGGSRARESAGAAPNYDQASPSSGKRAGTSPWRRGGGGKPPHPAHGVYRVDPAWEVAPAPGAHPGRCG